MPIQYDTVEENTLEEDVPEEDHELAPLIPGPTDRRRNNRYWIRILVVIAIIEIFAFIIGYRYLDSKNLANQQQWEGELQQHRIDEERRVDEWEQKFDKRQREETERQEREERQWKLELQQHRMDEERRMDEWEQKFDERRREETERQEREERQWKHELQQHRMDEERRMSKWEQEFIKRQREEVERQEREKKREEQWQREEEERERLGLYWDIPQEDVHCAGFNTRHYRARLLNTVSYNYNWLKPCLEIPLVIHGRNVKASRCEVQGSGIVYGHWTVDFDEPLCTPYWDQFNDKGCTAEGSHHRRYEAHLEGVDEENAEIMCASAPNDFKDLHFDHPTSCVNWGKYGIFGIWIVEDPSC